MERKNKKAWESGKLSKHYANQRHIQRAESAILERLRAKLPKMHMLDIGVGGGRTTGHFAPLAKEYLGIDYSTSMIDSCADSFPEYEFRVMDVRNMSSLKGNSFDFVLLSHNGLDYIPTQDRERALREISRVMAPDATFAFSTHNIKSIGALYSQKSIKGLIKMIVFRALNGSPSKIERLNNVVINDGSCGFRLKTNYTNLEHQLRMLENLDFKNVEALSGITGGAVSKEDLAKSRDPWIYFVCNN